MTILAWAGFWLVVGGIVAVVFGLCCRGGPKYQKHKKMAKKRLMKGPTVS